MPHARIVNIDTSKAKALPGVLAVLTGADVKDIFVGTRVKDQPVLAFDKVRTCGDAVAAVAAESEAIADEAIGLIDVEYEELPYVEDPVEALKPTAPLIHEDRNKYRNAAKLPEGMPSHNLQSYVLWKNGDVAGFQKAARIFEHFAHRFASRLYRTLCLYVHHEDGASKCGRQTSPGFTRQMAETSVCPRKDQGAHRSRRRRFRREGISDRRAGRLLFIKATKRPVSWYSTTMNFSPAVTAIRRYFT